MAANQSVTGSSQVCSSRNSRILFAEPFDRRSHPEVRFCSFRLFLEKHGHRCVKEFDVFVEPWCMKPGKLVENLQRAACTPHSRREPIPANPDLTHVAGLSLTRTQTIYLRWLLWRAREAVVRREIAKSACIRVIHKLRLAVNRLADSMVSEGRLPHRELVFFLSFDELRQLIATRNPALVTR